MLTAVKNQFRVTLLSIKYAVMREMLNKVTFISNVVFMILNNATFIIQWLLLYSIKDEVGGYTFSSVMLLWGIAAGAYGVSRFFFKGTFDLSYTINQGKLDAYLIQPKNVLISLATADISVSALGDIIYAYIMVFIAGFSFYNLFLMTLFIILGGISLASLSIIFHSFSFYFGKSDTLADTYNSLMTNFATYPDGIFKGVIRLLLYTVVPVGLLYYVPIDIMVHFDVLKILGLIGITIVFIALAFLIFYKGLKKYTSSNLMSARV